MSDPVFEPAYWKQRLAEALDREHAHYAVFQCPDKDWREMKARHHDLLMDQLKPDESILDVGCGWGRLITLLPDWWDGFYLGVDISPDMIDIARRTHPDRMFAVHDMRNPLTGMQPACPPFKFDWAVCVGFRKMVIDHAGAEEWLKIAAVLKASAQRVMYLEMDTGDKIESF